MREISIHEIKLNPFSLISDEWLLITAGNEKSGYNTMTACWGHLGSIWGHGKGLPTSIVYVRPQRYTKKFIDREDFYTLSFFNGKYKKALSYLGTHSGRDEHKIKQTNLTPVFNENTTYFSEAKLVFICRKLYSAPLRENDFFSQKLIDDNYPEKDFHTMYIGEIIKVFVQSEI